jgi:CubicO group peptidase (beta-lactamase class C family)
MLERDLAGLLREHMPEHPVPGAALGVLRDGALIAAYAGVADMRSGEPVTAQTRFAVGSLAKPMVATVIARLAEAGSLTFDDPVAAHVPELRGIGWAEGATLRDLLANRSRLPLRWNWEFSELGDGDDDVLSLLAAAVAKGTPTDVWSYSNVGWGMLGRAIETVTGSTWEHAMRGNLLLPLGMDGTTFATSPVAEPRASGHEVTADGAVPVEPWTPLSLRPAGSTLLSTASDVLRFAAAHLDDPSLAELRLPHADIAIASWFDRWCLGWAQFDCDGGPIWGWDGVISGQRSVLRLVPAQRAAVVLLTNGSNGRALYRSLFGELMDACFAVTLPTPQLEPSIGVAGDLGRYAGAYAWPDVRWNVTATETNLLIERNGRTTEALPIDERTFLVNADDPDNPTVTFGSFDREGRAGALYRMLWGYPRA